MIESRQVILSAVPHLDMDRKQKSKFRPCIDLHNGQVKQIVGGTLSDDDPSSLKTNFVARCVPPHIVPVDWSFSLLAVIG